MRIPVNLKKQDTADAANPAAPQQPNTALGDAANPVTVTSTVSGDGAPAYPVSTPASQAAAQNIDVRDSHQVMRRISLRSLAANKVRLLLTILAVVLGTSFVAGSMMFTRSLSQTYDSLLNATIGQADAVVSAKDESLTTDTIAELRDRDDVASVAIQASKSVVVADEDRQRLDLDSATATVQPWNDASTSDNPPPTAATLVEGNGPSGSHEVLMSRTALQDAGLQIGDDLILVDDTGQRDVEIVGAYSPKSADQDLGLLMEESAFIDNYSDGEFNAALVQAAGVSADTLQSDLAADYPQFEVKTGQAYADELSDFIGDSLRFISYFLIAFGLLALLVGIFIIANTFSMIVAQRMREFALLRALGVSKKQLSRSVLLEALIVGLIGSVLGVLLGVGLVQLIYAVMEARGLNLPSGGLGLSVGAVLVPIILGVIVTVISAYAPAQRAAKIHPVEAMRAGEANAPAALHTRTVCGVAVLGGAVLLCLLGAFVTAWGGGVRAMLVGFGTLLLFVGLFLAAPALSIPVVGAIGRGIGKPFGAIGRLAATNSHRNPRRTATTAFALTIGIALVTSIGMLSTSMKHNIEALMDDELTAEFVLAPPLGSHLSIPVDLMGEIAEVDGVADAVSYGTPSVVVGTDFRTAQQNMFRFTLTTMDGNPTTVFQIDNVQGDLALDQPGQILASQEYLDEFDLQIGDSLTMYGYDGTELRDVTVTGSFAKSNLLPELVVSRATFTSNGSANTSRDRDDEADEDEEETSEEETSEEESTEEEPSEEADSDGEEPASPADDGGDAAGEDANGDAGVDDSADVPETVVTLEDEPATEGEGDGSGDDSMGQFDVTEADIEPASYTLYLAQDEESDADADSDAEDSADSAESSEGNSEEVVLVNANVTTHAIYVAGDGSVSEADLRASLENAVRDYIVVDVFTADEFAGQSTAMIDQMMNLLYGLLALSVLIAVLGIINTLALNVIERRKEIGMLRAIGTQRAQIRRMVFLESTQIALFGALLGVITGLFMGWSFLQTLSEQGMESIHVSWGATLYLLLGSAVVGIVAAVLPAFRAAKTPPLEAISD